MTLQIILTPAELTALSAGQLVTIGNPPPVVVPPNPGTPAALKVVFAQNGATPLLPQDYSYSAVITRAPNSPPGNGNAHSIQVVAEEWGGFQPSNDNGKVTDFSQCATITVDVSAPAGSQFSIQFLRGGDLPIVGVSGNHFTKSKDGWETFQFPALKLMTDQTLGDVRASIYKGAIESQNAVASTTYLVDNWGGL